MENNLLQNIKAYFTDDVMNKLANHLGEDKEQVHKGVNIAIPSLLLGLLGRNQEGLSSILQSAKHLFSGFDLHDTLGKYFSKDDQGERSHFENDNLITSIFGDKLEGILQSVGKYLGMSPQSVSGLFGASIPAVISGITSKGGHWDVTEIMEQLNGSRSAITAAIPPGLGLGAFGSMFAAAEAPKELHSPDPSRPIAAAPSMAYTQKTVDNAKRGAGFWWILIPIVALALWFMFGKSCSNKAESESNTAVTSVDSNLTTGDSLSGATSLIDVALPDGNSLKAYASGIEDQLVQFLQSDYKSWTDDQLKAKWFNFDNLNFETGTANVTPESQGQLENIGKILKLFPGVKIKIGGYTDKRGDEALNKQLSQQRADAVKDYLDKQGLGSQVVGAEGYGSEFATAAWDASEKERAKDRRVAISIRN
ncbi:MULTISPECIES: OmpA family protein [Sphingobacterium]|uniref:OmpA family protein n=1 Tax=Sphingobacterium TaxID=28453 RepID=UPI0013D9F3AB|nr:MULTISPECIES: OmpA family protein [unclassified Sphingobacterium]